MSSAHAPHLPKVLQEIIMDYAAKFVLADWVDPEELNWKNLAVNPNAIDMMLDNPMDARWGHASSNPNAWPVLRDELRILINYDDLAESSNPGAVAHACVNREKLHYPYMLSRNPLAVQWLTKNPWAIDWDEMFANPKGYELLRARGLLNPPFNNRQQTMLRMNHSSWACDILHELELGISNYCGFLAENPYAFDIISKHRDKIPDYYLCANTNPRVLKLVLDDPKSVIDWYQLSMNPSAIEYLREHEADVDYDSLSKNPAIFELRRATWLKSYL